MKADSAGYCGVRVVGRAQGSARPGTVSPTGTIESVSDTRVHVCIGRYTTTAAKAPLNPGTETDTEPSCMIARCIYCRSFGKCHHGFPYQ